MKNPSRVSNNMQNAEWDEISQPFPNFNAVQLKFRIGQPLSPLTL